MTNLSWFEWVILAVGTSTILTMCISIEIQRLRGDRWRRKRLRGEHWND